MKIINELISQLESKKDKETVAKIGEGIACFTEYVVLMAEKKVEKNTGLKINKATEAEIKQIYKDCINNIKFLDCLSDKILNKKFYTKKSFDRKEVEKFLQNLIDKMFENRRVSRK